MNGEAACSNCGFFDRYANKSVGTCCRYPPRLAGQASDDITYDWGVWPQVNASAWCGEYKEREPRRRQV